MRVKVRLFGPLAERLGRSEITVEIAAATAGEALAAVKRGHPGLPLAGVRIAVNDSYADGRTALAAGDVVSLIPPVGGG